MDVNALLELAKQFDLADAITELGVVQDEQIIQIYTGDKLLYDNSRITLEMLWSETSYRIQAMRDNPDSAKQEFDLLGEDDPGLSVQLTYDPAEDISASYVNVGVKPKVAILREQGVNSQVEMAACFDRAHFSAVDVHMSDVLNGRVDLNDFKGLIACGGFSYGDVLGAGEGWAKTILFNDAVREAFQHFFNRGDTFTLGVCNGCQMMARLKELVPGAKHWPRFVRNESEQFESRFSLVKIEKSPSIFFASMEGSHMPVAVAHGEGRAEFIDAKALERCSSSGLVSARFVDNKLQTTERYPLNPNGSPLGITALCSQDGRVTIMMPHPERVFRTVSNSWHPDEREEDGAWVRMFRNARVFVD